MHSTTHDIWDFTGVLGYTFCPSWTRKYLRKYTLSQIDPSGRATTPKENPGGSDHMSRSERGWGGACGQQADQQSGSSQEEPHMGNLLRVEWSWRWESQGHSQGPGQPSTELQLTLKARACVARQEGPRVPESKERCCRGLGELWPFCWPWPRQRC